MTEGTIKTSKYEIIAIFREELRKQAEIEVFVNNKSTITQLTRVDFAEFHISTTSKIPAGHKVKFILHSDSGKIEFCSTLKKSYPGGEGKCRKVAFTLPECIQWFNAGAIPDSACATSTNSSVTADTKTEKTIYSKSKTFRTAVVR